MSGIAPNTPPQTPASPGAFYYMNSLQTSAGMGATLMLPYIATADPNVGDLADDYLTAFRTAIRGALSQWLPQLVGIERDAFYWMTGAGQQRWVQNSGSLGQGLVNSDYRPTQTQGLILKRSVRYPEGRGRFYAPYVPNVFTVDTENRLNADGIAALQFLASQLAQIVSTTAVDFLPATYHRASNSLERVTSYQAKVHTGTMMRRSPQRNWIGAVQISGNVWAY